MTITRRLAALVLAASAAALATVPAAAATPAATAAPPGFIANSVSWISHTQGWVLGAAPCPAGTCADVLGTIDGGSSWHLVGSIAGGLPVPQQSGATGVSEVRFATAKVGFAFGPDLWRTEDGGKTWSKLVLPGSGVQAVAFAANSQRAYVVVSRCGLFEGICSHPFTFWRSASLTSSSWNLVLHLPASPHADIAPLGSTVYVLDSTNENQPGPDPFYASADGVHFASRHDPCDTSNFVSLVQAVPVSASEVFLACVGAQGQLSSIKQVFKSDDRGATTTAVGVLAGEGTTAALAASTSGALVFASAGEQSYLFVNPGREKNWTTVVNRTDGGLGWNDVVFSSASTAWVVYAPYEESRIQIGQLWKSPDGGDHWEVVNL